VLAAPHERLARLVRRTSPFSQRLNEPDATYVEPHVPAEIRYLERTSQERLRHAAFRQLGGRWNHLPTVATRSDVVSGARPLAREGGHSPG
jgi:ATP-dependent DNA ligase